MQEVQTYRIEVRFDFTGTEEDARVVAQEAAKKVGGEVTAIMDEDLDDV